MVYLVDTVRQIAAVVLLLSAVGSACAGDTGKRNIAARATEAQSFAIYALSRGKGVPDSAMVALAKAQAELHELRGRGAEVTVTRERVGIEGETRLCVSFADKGLATETLRRIRQLVSGVDLLNLVEEPCGAVVPPQP